MNAQTKFSNNQPVSVLSRTEAEKLTFNALLDRFMQTQIALVRETQYAMHSSIEEKMIEVIESECLRLEKELNK